MAHARRYFSDAITEDPDRAEYVMVIFGKLYNLERNNSAIGHKRKYPN
ncbi:hypothetical protein [Sphingobacterium sp. HMA12]